jgi:hypothetical protein
MATRSFICDEISGQFVYCHWASYPSNHLKILHENYTTNDLVRELVSNGDMSSLGEDISKCVFYKDREGENLEDVLPRKYPDEYKAGDMSTEYSYFWNGETWRYDDVESYRRNIKNRVIGITAKEFFENPENYE